jgi:hypothetical protein
MRHLKCEAAIVGLLSAFIVHPASAETQTLQSGYGEGEPCADACPDPEAGPAPDDAIRLTSLGTSLFRTDIPDASAGLAGCDFASLELAVGAASCRFTLERPKIVLQIPDRRRLAAFADETDDSQDISLNSGPPEPRPWTYHVPREFASHPGFFKQAGAITTETLLLVGYFAFRTRRKLKHELRSFHFHSEGWFGKHRPNMGIDKLTHAYDTYILSEMLHARLHQVTNASQGDALTASIMASTLMALNEISDGFETTTGYSMNDVTMNFVGAGISLLRNTVPGMKEKFAFKIEIIPNNEIYSIRGPKHYAQQRFMFSLKGTGFKALNKSPLRYLDLQVGYYASRFLKKHRRAGLEPKRHLFVGIGLNVGDLLFGNSRGTVGKVLRTGLDYVQIPYTSLRYDTTGRLGN